MKTCTKCLTPKPVGKFRKRGPNGRRAWCKVCEGQYARNEAPGRFWTRLASNLSRYGGAYLSPGVLKEKVGYPEACYLCGDPIIRAADAEIDHVIPLAQGGPTTVENLKWAHRRCNRVKHDMRLGEMLNLFEKILRYQTEIPR